MIVIRSNTSNVFINLAAEDALLDDYDGVEPVVFIYRNDAAVVIGKNQNPWRECAVSRLDALGVQLARRVSGGGAVYHDPGNLNLACIVPRDRYQRAEMLDLFIAGLARAGIRAAVANSTSLVVDGRKISGNAFCYRRDKVLHHGTLLCRADLDRLRAALTPEIDQMETRAVASVRMPVVNLAGMVDDATLEASLLASLATRWGANEERDDETIFRAPDFPARVERMRSWAWRFGATPDFQIMRDGQPQRVHRGLVEGTGEKFQSLENHP